MANALDREIKVLSAEIVFLDTSVAIGTLPLGSRIVAIKVLSPVANNAGTTAVVDVGISGATTKYCTNVDLIATGDLAVTLLTPVVPTADEELLATVTEAGTAATAGAQTVIVEYVQP